MGTNGSSVQFAGCVLGSQRQICAFFNSIDEEHRVLGSFIRDGFDHGDIAFHIVDPEQRHEHLRRLTEAGINGERAMHVGQLEVRRQDAYLREDRFDRDAMLSLIEEVLRSNPPAGRFRSSAAGHYRKSEADNFSKARKISPATSDSLPE
jgi:hypothetical protein